jgi:hypothetical protein
VGVHVVKLPNGDHQLGAEIEGVFVPFASHSAGRIAQYVERGHNLAERAENGDGLARDQIGTPIEEPETSSKPVSKMTKDELDAYAVEHEVDDYPAAGNVADKRAAIAEYESASGEES